MLDPPLSPSSSLAEIFRRTCLGGFFSQFSPPPQILFFFWVKTPCKISEPYVNPFWEKSNCGGKKKEREKNAVISGHLVPWQRMQAARTNI